jgi:hypothetical protein
LGFGSHLESSLLKSSDKDLSDCILKPSESTNQFHTTQLLLIVDKSAEASCLSSLLNSISALNHSSHATLMFHDDSLRGLLNTLLA